MGDSCLCCHTPLGAGEAGYHPRCARRLFGSATVPMLDSSTADLEELAAQWLATHATVTGVQPKLSLHWQRKNGMPRLTIVGAMEGQFILKMPYSPYPHMPEVEALCMNLASACGMPVAPFGLLRLKDDALCYITRRMDRAKSGKIAMEDLCQLSERLTEDKYKGSHEQVAKRIHELTGQARLSIVRYYEQVLFSFLIGNSDMHLKNFSLYAPGHAAYTITPAYDLVSSQLLMPTDTEELALALNGAKRNLQQGDFITAMDKLLPAAVRNKLFARIQRGMRKWPARIEASFLPAAMRADLHALIAGKAQQVGMGYKGIEA